MNLKHLTDGELLNCTDQAVGHERKSTTQVLHHFKEVERRRLFSAHGYSSLFQMVVARYGYTEDQANYRISAMRLLKELPELEEKISKGALSLTHLNMARSHFRNEKKITSKESSREEKLDLLRQMENTSKRQSQEVLLSHSSSPQILPYDEIRPIAEDKILLKFVGDKDLEKQIARLKGLLAHKSPGISLGDLFKKLCELGIQEWSPKVSQERSKSNDTRRPGPVRVAVHKPNQAAIHRNVWQRDNGRCTKCGSIYAIEKDHSVPRAKGGTSSISNLRLLCRSCNQRAAIDEFGLEFMDKYINRGSE